MLSNINYYVLDETVACNLYLRLYHLYASDTSPDPKLSGRNKSENFFFPHQVQLSSNIHLREHHKPLVSASITDTQAQESTLPVGRLSTGEVLRGWCSAPAPWSSVPTGAALGALNAVPAPPCLHQSPPQLPQLITWRHNNPCKQSCCLSRSSLCSVGHYPGSYLALTSFKGNKRCSSGNSRYHLEARSTVLKIASWKPYCIKRTWHFWNEIFVVQRLCITFRHTQIISLS